MALPMARGRGRRRHLCDVAAVLGVASFDVAYGAYSAALVPIEDSSVRPVSLFGDVGVHGFYFAPLELGTPARRVMAAIDLESAGIAVPCKEHDGDDDVKTQDLGFNPHASSSAETLSCEAECTALGGTCDQSVCSYSRWEPWDISGSGISGTWLNEKVKISGKTSETAIACDERSFDSSNFGPANGKLGLGRVAAEGGGPQNPLSDGTHRDKVFFAICLANNGGLLTVNGHNEELHEKMMEWAPLVEHSSGYQVQLTGMRLFDEAFEGSDRVMSMSTTTASSFFPTALYRKLREGIEQHCFVEDCAAIRHGACWQVGDRGLDRFPAVKLDFGSNEDGSPSMTQEFAPSAYLRRQGSTAMWCYAFDDSGEHGETVLGSAWMRNKELVFDSWQGRLFMAPANCPEQQWPGASTGGTTGTHEPPKVTPTPGGVKRDDSLIQPLPQSGESDEETDADSSENLDQKGKRVFRKVFMIVAFALGVTGFLFFNPQGRAIIEGGGRAQLRETLIDDGAGGPSGVDRPDVEAAQESPVELAGPEQDAAEDQE